VKKGGQTVETFTQDEKQMQPSQLHPASPHQAHHLAVGMMNSLPLLMLSGQRCMIDFCLV
jgi:hypothetical protein